MTCCRMRIFLQNLKSIKDRQTQEPSVDIDLCHAYRMLKNEILDLFPINEVPQVLVDYLLLLKERINIAEEQLDITIDRAIEAIEKEMGA